MRVNIGQAKTDLSKLLARVEAGEDVEIARAGVPVARFVRIDPSQRPGPGSSARTVRSRTRSRSRRISSSATTTSTRCSTATHEAAARHPDRAVAAPRLTDRAGIRARGGRGGPFDRLLIAQARCEGLTIVTADRRFTEYDVPVVYAA